MSNSLTIAAVTRALRDLLEGVTASRPEDPDTELSDVLVTSKPLDKAGANTGRNQLNVFLYQISPNASLSNLDPPGASPAGSAPLALILHYLVTAYGREFDDVLGHRVLGRAMSILHDHPILSPGEFRLSGADAADERERMRITLDPLSNDEMSKLWTGFQSQYRTSVAYRVSPAIIEARSPARRGPAVLSRHIDVQPAADRVRPYLTGLAIEAGVEDTGRRLPSARLAAEGAPGDRIVLRGTRLRANALAMRFSHRLLADDIERDASLRAGEEIVLSLPEHPRWPGPAGFYTVRVSLRDNANELETNALSFALAPRLLEVSPRAATAGDISLNVRVTPPVFPGQRVSLLVGLREVAMASPSSASDTLAAMVRGLEAGMHAVRLRVDGVDSMPVDGSGTSQIDPASVVAVS